MVGFRGAGPNHRRTDGRLRTRSASHSAAAAGTACMHERAARSMMSHAKASSLSAGRIALGYAVLAMLWIAYTDALVTRLKLPALFMTYKGGVFVLVTASLLYFTIRRLVQAVQRTSRERDQTAKLYRTV